MPNKHSMISPSKSERWLNCTGSVKFEQGIQTPELPSPYAEEGTLAHRLCELKLLAHYKPLTLGLQSGLDSVKADPKYTDEMEQASEDYVSYIISTTPPQALTDVEHTVDLASANIIPEGIGTVDFVNVSGPTLHLYDFKYGKGVPVYAENNSQMMVYALGLLYEFELLEPIEQVQMTIIQPRVRKPDTWTISAEELKRWNLAVLQPTIKDIVRETTTFKAGDWCRWCRARAACREYSRAFYNSAAKDFQSISPNELPTYQLLNVLSKSKAIRDWLDSVEKYLTEQALAGTKFDGYKLVRTRTNRRWINEASTIQALKSLGLSPKEFVTAKLQPISTIEKVLKSHDIPISTLDTLITKPEGAPVLAPEDDNRMPIEI